MDVSVPRGSVVMLMAGDMASASFESAVAEVASKRNMYDRDSIAAV